MRKLSFSVIVLSFGLLAGCGGETSAGGQNGAPLNSSGAGGQAGSGQAGTGQAGTGQAGTGQAGTGQAGSGGAAGFCPVSQIGQPCSGEGSTCKTGLKCEPLELICEGGVWTAKEPPCGQGGAGQGGGAGAGGGSQCGGDAPKDPGCSQPEDLGKTCANGGVCSTTNCVGDDGKPVYVCVGQVKKCGGKVAPTPENTCADDEYCRYEMADQCGAFDSQGTCTKKPTSCPEGCPLIALCGCDGSTYCNECDAAMKGVSLTECKPAGCEPPSTPAQLCVDGKIKDICLGPNEALPEAIVDCGGGTCVPAGQTCGAKKCGGKVPPTPENTCAADEYCKLEVADQCGAFDSQGTCTKKPASCNESCTFVPLCGCDGQTYCNECEAASKGVNLTECKPAGCEPPSTPVKVCVDGKITDQCFGPNEGAPPPFVDCGGGACVADGQACGKACGGIAGIACAADEFCKYDAKSMCGAADQMGTCAKKPASCADGCNFVPLCGCDGNQYCNECEAAKAGTSVTECSPDKICGGFAGFTCGADEYCDFPDEAICGAADGSGVCRKMPVCPAPSPADVPACGCDGEKYPSACVAAAKGVDTTPCGAKKQGDECGSDGECGGNLLCCYPCGIPGCKNQCQPPGNNGQCPLLP